MGTKWSRGRWTRNDIDDADEDNDEASLATPATTSTLSDSADFHKMMIGSLSGRPARALHDSRSSR